MSFVDHCVAAAAGTGGCCCALFHDFNFTTGRVKVFILFICEFHFFDSHYFTGLGVDRSPDIPKRTMQMDRKEMKSRKEMKREGEGREWKIKE